MTWNGLFCTDVLLRSYSLTHSLTAIGVVFVLQCWSLMMHRRMLTRRLWWSLHSFSRSCQYDCAWTGNWGVCVVFYGKLVAELWSITCHTGSHGVIWWMYPASTPAKQAGTRFISERRQAELTFVVGYVHRWFTCMHTVTHFRIVKTPW